jgi:hypothetical protein
MNTPCECPLSGFCNRHNINKNETEHRLCFTDKKYFDMWEKKSNITNNQELKKEPGIIKKAGNFFKAVTEHVGSGLEQVTDELKEQRINICNDCSYLDKENFKCTHCGCWLKYKTAWATSSCPIGKW